MTDSLSQLLDRDHKMIMQLCRSALDAEGQDRWQQLVASDAFLAMGSRHLAAVEDVLYPAIRRRIPDGRARARAHAHEARSIERTMRRILASTYGEVHDLDTPRHELWAEAESLLAAHMRVEADLAAAVERGLPAGGKEALATAYLSHFERAPTRPHPYLPHSSPIGRVARRVWSLADQILDVMDNRMVQRRRKTRSAREDLITQYLTGRPRFETDYEQRDRRP